MYLNNIICPLLCIACQGQRGLHKLRSNWRKLPTCYHRLTLLCPACKRSIPPSRTGFRDCWLSQCNVCSSLDCLSGLPSNSRCTQLGRQPAERHSTKTDWYFYDFFMDFLISSETHNKRGESGPIFIPCIPHPPLVPTRHHHSTTPNFHILSESHLQKHI
jgi:hypothetical protein